MKILLLIVPLIISLTTPAFAQQERITANGAELTLVRNGVPVEVPADKHQPVIEKMVSIFNTCGSDTSQDWLRKVWEKEGVTIEQRWHGLKDGSYLSLKYPQQSPFPQVIVGMNEKTSSFSYVMAQFADGQVQGFIKCSGHHLIELFCMPEILPHLPKGEGQEELCKRSAMWAAMVPPKQEAAPKPLPVPVPSQSEKKISKVYYSDGRIYSETDLFSDRYNGFYKTFHPNGQLATEVRYKDNHQVYDKAFDEQGKPIFRHGMVTESYIGGIRMCEGPYRNDQKHGKQVCYYYDGKTVVDVWHYMNGRRVDAHIRNDAAGNFVSEEDWGYPTYYVRKLQWIIAILGGLVILLFIPLILRRKNK